MQAQPAHLLKEDQRNTRLLHYKVLKTAFQKQLVWQEFENAMPWGLWLGHLFSFDFIHNFHAKYWSHERSNFVIVTILQERFLVKLQTYFLLFPLKVDTQLH